MKLKKVRAIMKSKQVPYYALPAIDKLDNILSNYIIGKTTVKRLINRRDKSESKIVRITKKLQSQIYKAIIFENKIEPLIIGFSSQPNDLLACELAGYYLYNLLNNRINLRWKWVNAAAFNPSSIDRNLDVVIIQNISINGTQGRQQIVRDIINYYTNTLRIVVVAGTNAIDFFDNYINCSISGMVHLVGRKHLIKINKKTDLHNIQALEEIFTPDLSPLLKNYNTIKLLK